MSSRTQPSVALGISAAGLERGVEIDARRAQRRRQTKENAGEDGDGKRECEDGAVETDRLESRNIAWIDGANRTEGSAATSSPATPPIRPSSADSVRS